MDVSGEPLPSSSMVTTLYGKLIQQSLYETIQVRQKRQLGEGEPDGMDGEPILSYKKQSDQAPH